MWKQLANTLQSHALHIWIARIVVGKVIPQYPATRLYPAPHAGGKICLEAIVQNRAKDNSLEYDVEETIRELQFKSISFKQIYARW